MERNTQNKLSTVQEVVDKLDLHALYLFVSVDFKYTTYIYRPLSQNDFFFLLH